MLRGGYAASPGCRMQDAAVGAPWCTMVRSAAWVYGLSKTKKNRQNRFRHHGRAACAPTTRSSDGGDCDQLRTNCRSARQARCDGSASLAATRGTPVLSCPVTFFPPLPHLVPTSLFLLQAAFRGGTVPKLRALQQPGVGSESLGV
eukprot:scaffold13983_cov125-Isochrysis_galbana.AAC.15